MIKIEVSLVNEQNKYNIDEEKISSLAFKMLDYVLNNEMIIKQSKIREKYLKDFIFNVDFMFCLDNQIHELNRDYRNIDRPTDVLSFALFVDNKDSQIMIDNHISLGEVIISLETTERQALDNNKSFDEEMAFLLSHGILHLIGFDHTDEKTLSIMLDIQDEIINKVKE